MWRCVGYPFGVSLPLVPSVGSPCRAAPVFSLRLCAVSGGLLCFLFVFVCFSSLCRLLVVVLVGLLRLFGVLVWFLLLFAGLLGLVFGRLGFGLRLSSSLFGFPVAGGSRLSFSLGFCYVFSCSSFCLGLLSFRSWLWFAAFRLVRWVSVCLGWLCSCVCAFGV